MATLYPFHQFILMRVAGEQRRAARALMQMSAKTAYWHDILEGSCDKAKTAMANAMAQNERALAASKIERERTLTALARGDLQELVAERDRLQTKLSAKCAHCGYLTDSCRCDCRRQSSSQNA